jgi:hypothetical protein
MEGKVVRAGRRPLNTVEYNHHVAGNDMCVNTVKKPPCGWQAIPSVALVKSSGTGSTLRPTVLGRPKTGGPRGYWVAETATKLMLRGP